MTIKQDWQRERAFANKGRLVGIATQLKTISHSHTILPSEAIRLRKAIINIQDVLDGYNTPITEKLSYEQYERIKS